MNIYLFEFIFLFLLCLWVKTVSILLIILLKRFIFSNSKMKINKNYICTIALLNNKFINYMKEMVEHLFIYKQLIDYKIYKYLISKCKVL